ncbi:MAG: phage/plasmid primase, P4 family [Bacteriovoracaceae bacterium]|nr:phage/plasmid primase, P4 family [Bacteriovoracaceae bacterium]
MSVNFSNIDIFLDHFKYRNHDGTPSLVSYNGKFYIYGGKSYAKIKKSTLISQVTKLSKINNDFIPEFKKEDANSLLFLMENILSLENVNPNSYLDRTLPVQTYPIAFNNKIVHFEIRGDHLITSEHQHTQSFFSEFNLNYNFASKKGCKKFIKLLNEILTPSQIYFLQEFVGYLMLPTTRTHKLLICQGEGGEGKSLLFFVISLMLGEQNVSSVALSGFLPNGRFQLANAYDKLLNLVDEIDEKGHIVSSIIKRWAVGGKFQIESKFQDPFEASVTARLVILTNFDLNFLDDSNGLKRRLLILRFKKQIKEENQNSNFLQSEYWQDELTGIRNWAIRGLERLIRNKWKFSETEEMKNDAENLYELINPSIRFLKDYFEYRPGNVIFGTKIYDIYKNHCIKYGIKPQEESVFNKNIKKAFPKVTRHSNAIKYGESLDGKPLRSHPYTNIALKEETINEIALITTENTAESIKSSLPTHSSIPLMQLNTCTETEVHNN